MRDEYDFSKGVRGTFYRRGAELRLPIYLGAKLQAQVERLAEQNGKDVGEMVNQLVQKEVNEGSVKRSTSRSKRDYRNAR